MARGATQAQRKQRAQTQAKPKKPAQTWEDQLFFSRLRRHAKVIYVLLAIVFGLGFVILGVGSGSTGIGDILQGKLFGSSGSSASSQIKDKQQQISAHPNNVSLYLDLAGLYQAQHKNSQALAALARARSVAPKDIDVLNRIAAVYSASAASAGNAYQNALNTYFSTNVPQPGLDTSSQLGQALTSDPYSQALQQRVQSAYTKATTEYSKVESVYKQAVDASKGTSQEPGALLQWATAAQNANDVSTAITAYKRFLAVAPDNPNAPAVKQTLKQLQASAAQSQR